MKKISHAETSLFSTKSVTHTCNLYMYISSAPKLPQSVDHFLEFQHRWDIHASTNLHGMEPAPLCTLHKVHWHDAVILLSLLLLPRRREKKPLQQFGPKKS